MELPPETSLKKTQELAELVLPKTKIREWHYALMDFAKTLPSEVHKKYKNKYAQSKFEGSIRQIRGEIIRQLTQEKHLSVDDISNKMNRIQEDVHKAITSLVNESIIVVKDEKIKLL